MSVSVLPSFALLLLQKYRLYLKRLSMVQRHGQGEQQQQQPDSQSGGSFLGRQGASDLIFKGLENKSSAPNSQVRMDLLKMPAILQSRVVESECRVPGVTSSTCCVYRTRV